MQLLILMYYYLCALRFARTLRYCSLSLSTCAFDFKPLFFVLFVCFLLVTFHHSNFQVVNLLAFFFCCGRVTLLEYVRTFDCQTPFFVTFHRANFQRVNLWQKFTPIFYTFRRT